MKSIKTYIITFAALLITSGIYAQQLDTSADTLQYTLGAFVGQWMKNNRLSVSDPVIFNRGIEDVMMNRPLAVSDSTIIPRIAAYQLSTQSEKSRQMEEQMFAALKGQPGVGVLPNGVHYIVMKATSGMRPMANDSIVFNTVGVFPDGTQFEDTFQKNKALRNTPENLIPGLNEAVQLMPEGSVWRIFVPSALAYGAAGVANVIPPNSALVFELTLEEVKRK